MVCGIGVDLIEVERIGRARRRWGGRFLERVFTDAELSDCLRSATCDQRLAARFAAKEATLKALGTGLAKGARWREIEVRYGERGCKGKVSNLVTFVESHEVFKIIKVQYLVVLAPLIAKTLYELYRKIILGEKDN